MRRLRSQYRPSSTTTSTGQPSRSSRSSFSGKMTYIHTYGLHKKADTVTAKVKYFNKVETLKVPIKTSVCLGL